MSNRDISTATLILQEIADNYRKMSWLFNFKSEFLKFFGAYVHGLYYVGCFVLESSLFNQIESPKHSIFWNEFDQYTKGTDFSKGITILKFENNLETVKRLFD